ncbi:VCBS domain-containing protein [Desulfovibrio sp.]|uniref:VCBS domain-containing protein n=1 Tax=Desulfovibrio sp. TaxID=885 RepID=UPI0025B80DBC|nr:VCBS domain-containing protein [Desulfovibrio sp.]
MADIKLVRPSAGQTAVIPSAPDARMVLDFSADQVSIERPQGSDSLFFRFDDGAAIELQNFYTQYNKDDIPSFEVDGQLIAGADFFSAFGPDLAPAAGPSASPTRSGRYSDFANAGLEDGVNHLDGLDYRLGFGGDTQPNINPYASPFLANAAPTLSTGGAAIAIGLTESAWDGKSASAAPVVSQSGSFSVADPDGDSLTTTVSMGGKVVAVSTAGPTTVASDYGTLVITPKGGGSNVTFEYTYTLKQDPYSPTDSLAEGEKQADNIVFSINDGKGHTVTQPINVVITGSNDAPDITGVQNGTVKDDGVWAKGEPSDDNKTDKALNSDELNPITASGTDEGQQRLSVSGTITAVDPDHDAQLTFGFVDVSGAAIAKGSVLGNLPDAANTPIEVTGVTQSGTLLTITTDCGTLTLTTSGPGAGQYTFKLDSDADKTNQLAEGKEATLTLRPTVTDNHGVTDGSADIRTGGSIGNLELTIKGSNDLPSVTDNQWRASTPGIITEDVKNSEGEYKITGTIMGKDVDAGEAATLAFGFAHESKMESTLYVVPNGTDTEGKLQYSLSTAPPADGNYYGTLTITGGKAADDGQSSSATYSFELNNSADCVQALDNGSSNTSGTTNWTSLVVAVPVVVRDSVGGYVEQDIHLTIKGANDLPTFTSGNAAHSVKENGVYLNGERTNTLINAENTTLTTDHVLTATGSVAANDVDGHGASDTLTYSLQLGTTQGAATIFVTAQYTKNADGTSSWKAGYTTAEPASTDNSYLGKLTMGTDGSYKFELVNTTNDNSAANRMGEGATLDLTFTPAVHDGTGYNVQGSSVPTITITVNGSNEAPTIKSAAAWGTSGDTLVETGFNVAGTANIIGSFKAGDVDAGDKLTYSLALGGTESANFDGAKLYRVLYLVKDGEGGIKLTTAAGNDGDANYYGKVSINQSGKYTVDLFNNSEAVQELKGDGSTDKTFSFTMAAQDNHGAYVTQTVEGKIKGSNDAPHSITITSAYVKDDGVWADGTSSTKLVAGENRDVDPETGAPDFTTQPAAGVYRATATGTVTAEDHEGDTLTFKLWDGSTEKASITSDYGTLSLDPTTGKYTFTLAKSSDKVNALGEGTTHPDTFTVRVYDGKGGYADSTITINIVGTNDAPKVDTVKWTGSSNGIITESGSVPASIKGQVTGKDVDTGEEAHLKFGLVTEVTDSAPVAQTLYVKADGELTTEAPTGGHNGYYGQLTIDASNGKYTFTLYNDSKSVQGLDGNYDKTISIPVVVIDPKGAYGHSTINVTIKGENDATTLNTKWLTPDKAAIEEGVQPATKDRTEDSQYKNEQPRASAKGYIGATDVDTTDQAELEKSGSDAKLHYSITTTSGNVIDINNHLALTDGSSGTGWEVATVHGVKHLYVTTEYGRLDITAFDFKALTVDEQAKFSAGPMPAFSYTFSATDTLDAVQELQYNGKLSDGFTITVTGTKDTKPPTFDVQLTINGTNDRPEIVIHESQTHIKDNETTLTLTGKLTAEDVDDKSGFTYSLVEDGSHTKENLSSDNVIMKGDHGWIELNGKTGEYTYHLTDTDKMAKLNSGEKSYDTFYVRVMDAHGAYSEIKELKVTIDGTNHEGSLNASSATASGAEAGVTTEADYSANANLHFTSEGDRYLGANEEKLPEAIGHTLKVDDKDNTNYGNFRFNDADNDNKVTVTITKNGVTTTEECSISNGTITTSYGSLTLNNSTGVYSFTVNEDTMNPLTPKDNVSIRVSVSADSATTVNNADGTNTGANLGANATVTDNLIVNIRGTNDAPVVQIDAGKLTGGFTTLHSGTAAVDFLVADSALVKEFIHDYVPGKGLSWLANLFAGGLDRLGLLDDFLKSSTEAQAAVSDFLTGKFGNQVLVDSDETASWNSKGGHLEVRGDLNQKAIVTDVDNGHKLTFFVVEDTTKDGIVNGPVVQQFDGKYGTLVIQPDGSYQYILDRNGRYAEAFKGDALGSGTEKFTIYVRDEYNAVAEKPIELVINVNGPGLGGGGGTATIVDLDNAGDKKDVYEDGVGGLMKITGSVAADESNTKYDNGMYLVKDDGGKSSVISNDYGTITLLPDGTYTYTLNNDHPAVQGLGKDEKLPQYFKVINGAGEERLITIIIHGTNDVPYLTSKDPELSMHQGETGGWDKAEVEGSFTATDRDVIDRDSLSLVDKDGNTLSGAGTNATPYIVHGEHGEYHIWKETTQDGQTKFSYTYTLNNTATNYDGAASDKVTFLIADGHGGTVEKSLTVDLSAENAKPTLTNAAATHEVVEDSNDGVPLVSATVPATDGDAAHLGGSSALSYAIEGDSGTGMYQGKYGTLFLTADGTYTYKLNNNDPRVQALGAGEKLTDEQFTIKVSDNGRGNDTPKSSDFTVNITVSGTNDAPSITLHEADGTGAAGSGAALYITEGDMASVSGQARVYDVDTYDTHTYAIKSSEEDGDTVYAKKNSDGAWKQCKASEHGTAIGTFEIGTDGKYTFTLSKDADALAHGDKVVLNAIVTVTDNSGVTTSNSATAKVQVTVTGTNTAPVIEKFTDIILEDVAATAGSPYTAPTLTGSIYATDADALEGEKLSYFIKSGNNNVTQLSNTYGTLKLDATTGEYTFTLNNDGVKLLRSLGQDKSLDSITAADFAFTLVAKDKYGAEGEKTLHIDLAGVNDAPVATSGTFGTANGQLHAIDPDTGDTIDSYALQKDAAYGHVVVSDDGHYNYDLNIHSEQELDALQHHLSGSGDTWATSFTDSFMFTATDNHKLTSAPGTASLAFDVTVKEEDGGHHVDITTGGETSHLLFGSNSADYLDASSETQNHILYGGGGDDILQGGSGDDILYGGTGHNELYGEGGNDTLYAGNDGDHLYGGAGNDHLYGGAGNDHLYGGDGNDFLDGGAGNNVLYGGAGNNVLVFHQGDTIDGGTATGLNVLINHSTENLDSLLADPSQVKNVSVSIQDGAQTGDGTDSLTDMNALINAGIKMGTDSISLDSSQWTKGDDGKTFTNTSHDLVITTTADIQVTDHAADKQEFILKNS